MLSHLDHEELTKMFEIYEYLFDIISIQGPH